MTEHRFYPVRRWRFYFYDPPTLYVRCPRCGFEGTLHQGVTPANLEPHPSERIGFLRWRWCNGPLIYCIPYSADEALATLEASDE